MKLIDIKAPCQEVFDTVINTERRMQLSPLWGLSELEEITPNFPEPGSSYRVRVLTNAPFGLSQGTLNASQSAFAGLAQFLSMKMEQSASSYKQRNDMVVPKQPMAGANLEGEANFPTEQNYFVAEYQPPHKFSYYLDDDCKTVVTWRFQSIPFGTRINYEEVFCDENLGGEDFIPTVRHVISEWLTNIKRYSELHDGRGRKIVKWFLDRFYLKMRPDQRRVVLVMLFMQVVGISTFMIALIGWGVASLFF
ncbi:MAG: hypothetical protein PVJ21_06420 [Anaerolineales bacterium]